MDLSLDFLCIVDFEGRWRRVNAAFERLVGRSSDDLAGRPCDELIHPQDREHALTEMRRLATVPDQTIRFDARVLCEDRSYRLVSWRAKASPEDLLIYAVGRDVTPRSEAEVAAREAEERFQATFDQAPIGMALVSLERSRPGCFLRVNRALCDITGRSEEELVGADFQSVVYSDGKPDADLHYLRWMPTGELRQYELEKRLRHSAGHTIWALVTTSIVRDAEERPLYLLSQVQDITARKEAEQALRESRQRLQDIIDNTTAVIYVKDREGRFLLVNRRFEMLYDVARDEAPGKSDRDLFSAEQADAFRAKDLQVLSTGISLESEEVARHEDGLHTYLSVRFPMFHATDPNGAPYAVCAISTDITERKRAEEALRASEEHFRQIIDTAHDAFISIDSTGYITTWNPQAEKTFGWTASEAIGRRLERLIIPPAYREAHSRGLQRFLSVGMGPLLNKRVEMQALHRDDHEFPVEMSLTAVRVGGDYVFNAFLHDVSERKRAEENVRQLANLVESSGDAIIGIDGEGVIKSWNPAASQLYGYSSSEVVGRSVDTLVPPDCLQEEREHMARVLTGETIDLYEATRVRREGELVEVSVSLSPVKDAVGTIVGASAISRDITERKRAEEALRQVQEGFRSAFENAPIGVGLFSVDQSARRQLLQVNASLCEITGYSAQELLTTNLDAITHPLDLEKESPLAERLLAGEIPNYRLEKRYLRQDGSLVWTMQNVSTVYDSFGKLLYITERKHAEKQLEEAAGELERRAAELERSNADLQQFAYAASHDLSEPLRMVSSYVTLLARRYTEQLDQNAHDFIGFAVEGVERMQALIDGLLLYSRAGAGEYARTSVDCNTVVSEVLSAIEASIDESGAEITVQPLPVIEADRTQLSQLFQNLISNAIKFAEGTPRVSVSAEREGESWHFQVADNGIGIDPAHADRIFAVFQRLHSRENYAGSGIGLAICKRIVERQGGHIWVEARAEGGSTFHFTIPVQSPRADDSDRDGE